mgnify:FL=1|jgi:hypothetical protein
MIRRVNYLELVSLKISVLKMRGLCAFSPQVLFNVDRYAAVINEGRLGDKMDRLSMN